jgi:predicted signal transduction protein with EAL and GGDEF domain
LRLVHQPIVPIADGARVAVEALARGLGIPVVPEGDGRPAADLQTARAVRAW